MLQWAPNEEGLAHWVQKMMEAGWRPQGGVCVTHYDGDPRRFYQAMVRDADARSAAEGTAA